MANDAQTPLDQALEAARIAYVEGVDAHERLLWLTDRTSLEQMRAMRDGQRRKLTPSMIERLGQHAATFSILPADLQLLEAANRYAAEWNNGNPYGATFELRGPTMPTRLIVEDYLNCTGTHTGMPKQTRYQGLSTQALDAASRRLREHCPHGWATGPQDMASRAEGWLLRQLLQIEPKVGPEVIRAIINRLLAQDQ